MDERPDDSELIARANALRDADDFQAAVKLLKRSLEIAPESEDLRRALATLYRARMHYDQAGRWGIVLPGWTTEREREALFAAVKDMPRGQMRRHLSLRPGQELPVELEAIASREEIRATRAGRLGGVLTGVAGFAVAAAVLVLVAGVISIFTAVLSGDPAMHQPSPARSVLVVFWGLLTLAALLAVVGALVRRQWERLLYFAIAAAVGGGLLNNDLQQLLATTAGSS